MSELMKNIADLEKDFNSRMMTPIEAITNRVSLRALLDIQATLLANRWGLPAIRSK